MAWTRRVVATSVGELYGLPGSQRLATLMDHRSSNCWFTLTHASSEQSSCVPHRGLGTSVKGGAKNKPQAKVSNAAGSRSQSKPKGRTAFNHHQAHVLKRWSKVFAVLRLTGHISGCERARNSIFKFLEENLEVIENHYVSLSRLNHNVARSILNHLQKAEGFKVHRSNLVDDLYVAWLPISAEVYGIIASRKGLQGFDYQKETETLNLHLKQVGALVKSADIEKAAPSPTAEQKADTALPSSSMQSCPPNLSAGTPGRCTSSGVLAANWRNNVLQTHRKRYDHVSEGLVKNLYFGVWPPPSVYLDDLHPAPAIVFGEASKLSA